METLKFLNITMNYPPAHFGGDARFVEYLSNELVRAGHEVHVFHNPSVFELLRKEKVANLEETTQAGVHRHVYRAKMPTLDALLALNFGNTNSSRHQLEQLLNEVRPDVVHWHNTKGFFGKPLPVKSPVALYTAHDYFAVCPRSALLRPGYRICRKPFLCQMCLLRWRKPSQLWRVGSRRTLQFPEGTAIISPSTFLAGVLERDGIKVDHILRSFVPDTRELVGERKPGKSLLYFGLLEKQKGVLTLLEAFDRSRKDHDFDLWIVGEGSLKDRIRSKVNELKLSDRVKVPGFTPLEGIAPILRESAAVVVPSENYENAPLAVLEAFSSGVPVIGSDIGGLPEILGPESGSVVFPPGDVNRLAEIMRNLWNQKGNLTELGRLARTTYERDFHPSVHLKKYMRIVSKGTS